MCLKDLVVSESYFDQGIEMKRITTATAIGLIAVLIGSNAAAHAADEPRFPVIPGAPNWYMAASDAPYASTDATLADQQIVQEDDEWHVNAWWYDPNGGAPEAGEPDIVIETMLKLTGEAGATDPYLIVLSLNAAFPELTDSLGTEFTRGVAIPTGADAATPKMTFPGDGIILAQRPARDCTVTNDMKDPDRFIVNLAMLGENQHRYLVNFAVEFGTRTWGDACAALVGAQSAEEPEATTTADPAQKAQGAKKAPEVEVDAEDAAEVVQDGAEADAAASDTHGTLIAILAIAVLIAALVVAVLFRRRGRAFLNDGTPIDRADSSSPASVGTTKRSEFGR